MSDEEHGESSAQMLSSQFKDGMYSNKNTFFILPKLVNYAVHTIFLIIHDLFCF